MAAFANEGNMIPEQVWDREDPTGYGWRFGEGTGSATPLSWSMAVHPVHRRLATLAVSTCPSPTPSSAIPSRCRRTPTVVVRTGRDDDASDGRETTVALAPGRNDVTVVAATDAESLEAVGLATARTPITSTTDGDDN